MKKSVRINVLVITVVVTLFAGTGLWYLRPSVPNEVLEQARQRQSIPLMEVTPPVKKPSVEEVSNTKALVSQLLPELEMKLAPTLTESIRSSLLADENLVAELAKQIEPLLASSLSPALEAALASGTEAAENRLTAMLDRRLAEYTSSVEREGMKLASEVEARLAGQIAQAKIEVEAYVPQVVDALLPALTEQTIAAIEANKDAYVAYLTQVLPKGLGEAELIELYTAYRQQIVQDLVPTLLDGLEAEARKSVDAYVAQMPLVRVPASPSTPKPSVKVVPQVESVPEVVQQPVVAPAPAVVKPVVSPAEPVVAEPEPVVVEIVEPEPAPVGIVEPKPVIKEGQKIITLPDFEEEQQVIFLDPAEYEAQRQEIRKQAIDEVLRRIAP
jgi:flagellar basal body-associated protein FliL